VFKYFPIKMTFLVSIFIFEVGSLVCALAPTSESLVAGRAIAGLGASGVTAGVFILIAFSAPPKYVPAFMGLGGPTYALAALAGPLIGGVLTESVTWRWCFWINLPIGGVTAAVVVLVYKTPKAAQPQQATLREKLLQMDLVGTFLVMAAVVCFILAFQWGGSFKAWSDSTVIGTLVGFVLISVVFVANELYMGDRAILEPRLMAMRRIWANCAHVFFVSGGFFIHIYYIPIFFQTIQGLSPMASGVCNLPINIGCFLSIASGFLVSIYGRLWAPLMAIRSAIATVGAGLIYTFGLDTSPGAADPADGEPGGRHAHGHLGRVSHHALLPDHRRLLLGRLRTGCVCHDAGQPDQGPRTERRSQRASPPRRDATTGAVRW
jgi:MFS family permease